MKTTDKLSNLINLIYKLQNDYKCDQKTTIEDEVNTSFFKNLNHVSSITNLNTIIFNSLNSNDIQSEWKNVYILSGNLLLFYLKNLNLSNNWKFLNIVFFFCSTMT